MPMTRTIPRLLDSAVQDSGDRLWLLHEDESHTFGGAAARIAGAAHVLHEHGVGQGVVVMATTRNTSGYLFTWLAAVGLGAVLVPVDPGLGVTELAGLVAQTRPHVVVTDGALWATVIAATAAHPPAAGLLHVGDLHDEAASWPAPAADVRPEDVAVLLPTSGTTGRSKLVTQTHRAYVMAGEGFPHWMRLSADDRLMTSLPLFHINAPAYSVLGSVAARAGLVLLPRFSASGFLDAARRHGATEFNAIGAMLE
ncbi:MAG: AMP-binding protein, partial [Candidatus Dormibacteria bacterium]